MCFVSFTGILFHGDERHMKLFMSVIDKLNVIHNMFVHMGLLYIPRQMLFETDNLRPWIKNNL